MKSRGLERARMIAGERRAPAAKRWEVVNAKRPSTSGQALRRLSANIAERRRAPSAGERRTPSASGQGLGGLSAKRPTAGEVKI